jgi:hypothetical protein
MTITNRLNLPEGLVKACATDPHNKAGELSATTPLKGVVETKEIILTRRHWDGLTGDVAGRIWAVSGTATHALLEREGENGLAGLALKAEAEV